MKKLRYCLAVLAAVLVLAVPAYAVEMDEEVAAPEEIYIEIEYVLPELIEGSGNDWENLTLMDSASWTGTRYRDQLTEEGKRIYDKLESQFPEVIEYKIVEFSNGNEFCAVYEEELPTITVEGSDEAPVKAKENELHQLYDSPILSAYYAFTYDHPEYFWIRTNGVGCLRIVTWTYTNSYGEIVKKELVPSIMVAYVVNDLYRTRDARSNFVSQVDTVVDSILSECNGWPVIAQLAYFDNWLAENNQYNSYAAEKKMAVAGPAPWNATGALLTQYLPVCEGYAKAFQLLCHEINVPCVTVSSYNHMWNMVQVDGQWYHMDCTWNDPIVNGSGSFDYSTRKYFLISSFINDSSTGISASHVISQPITNPTVAGSDYFPAFPEWSMGENGIVGYTDVSLAGNSWMALYNNQRAMLEVLPCVDIRWGANQKRTIAPDFSNNAFSQAKSGQVFQIGADWKPVAAAQQFS